MSQKSIDKNENQVEKVDSKNISRKNSQTNIQVEDNEEKTKNNDNDQSQHNSQIINNQDQQNSQPKVTIQTIQNHSDNQEGERINLVTLLNFNEDSLVYPFLTSPRSKEACLRQGLEEYQLLRKSKKDFKREQIPVEFRDDPEIYINIKADKYEKRRQERLIQVIQEREDIMMEQQREHQYQSRSQYKITTNSKDQSGFPAHEDSERVKLDVLKRKQEQQIEFMIENQRKQQEIIEKQEQKELRVQEMERRKQLEMERKRNDAEEAEKYRQHKKYEANQVQQLKAEELLEKQKETEMKIKIKNQQLQRQREEEQIQRELERRDKIESIQTKILILTNEKKESIEQRKQERENKLIKVENLKHQELLERSRQIREREEEHIQKQQQQKQEMIRQKKLIKQKFEEKLHQTEIKRHHDQQLQEERLQERKLNRIQKERTIKRQISQNFKEDIEYKKSLLKRFEQKQLMLDSQKMDRLDQIMSKKKQQEMHQQEVLMRNRISVQNMKEENKIFLVQLNQRASMVSENRSVHIGTIKKKVALELLKVEEAKENQERVEKMRAYQKQKLLDKLRDDQLRIESQQRERIRQKRNREHFKKQLENEKELLVQQFASELDQFKNSKKGSQMQPYSTTTKNMNTSNYDESSSTLQKKNKHYSNNHSQENLRENSEPKSSEQNGIAHSNEDKENEIEESQNKKNQNSKKEVHKNKKRSQKAKTEEEEKPYENKLNISQLNNSSLYNQQNDEYSLKRNEQTLNESQFLLNSSKQMNNLSFAKSKVQAYGKDIPKEKLKLLLDYDDHNKTRKSGKKSSQNKGAVDLNAPFPLLRDNQIEEMNDNLNVWVQATENILVDHIKSQQNDKKDDATIGQISEKLLKLYSNQFNSEKQARKQNNFLGLYK